MKNGNKKLAAAMGADLMDWMILPFGIPMHDCEGLRMEKDPETRIVNPSGQFWRIKNFNGCRMRATWPSEGSANPYLTITAWALKQANGIALT